MTHPIDTGVAGLIDTVQEELGLTLLSWQKRLVEQILAHPDRQIIYAPQYGRGSISQVAARVRALLEASPSMQPRKCQKQQIPSEFKGPRMNDQQAQDYVRSQSRSIDGVTGEISRPEALPCQCGHPREDHQARADHHCSTCSKPRCTLYLPEVSSPVGNHAQVTVKRSDWEDLWRRVNTLSSEKDVLRERVTNQRRELRSLNRAVLRERASLLLQTSASNVLARQSETEIDKLTQANAILQLDLNTAKQAAEYAEGANERNEQELTRIREEKADLDAAYQNERRTNSAHTRANVTLSSDLRWTKKQLKRVKKDLKRVKGIQK